MLRRHLTPILRRALFAVALIALLQLTAPVSAQVTFQIINDSGLADSNIFVKVPGRLWNGVTNPPVTPTNLFVNIASAAPSNPASIPLSTLPSNGSLISSSSGNTDTVYTFQADYIASASLYFTYNQPFTFTNGLQPSPPPDSFGNALRYDYAEFSINDSSAQNNAVDVTYVDKFGIPLQMEWFQGTNLAAGSYVYASTKTLADRFTAAGLGQAVFALNASDITPGWQYNGPSSYTNFARILAPQKISGNGASVAPFPNVAYYLNSLVGSSHAFQLNGASPQAGYYYLGYQASLNTNAYGWVVTLAPTTNPPPFNPNLITGLPYTNTITFSIGYSNANQYVYGAPVGPDLYATNGTLVTTATSPTYAVETWMIGDVLSSLNFGFWGGRYGTNSANWFSPVQWTAFPFGSARATNDGFYNPYTALIYDNADPYGFAFSERITPDVLLTPMNGDLIRLTILPDNRLDSPVVTAPTNLITANSITLNWAPASGAGGYRVNVLRPFNFPTLNLPAMNTSYTLTNLQPGTPYVVSVQATGTATNGNPLITPARSLSVTTTGITATNSGSLAQMQVTFNAADPFYQLAGVYINGTELLPLNGQWLTPSDVPARWIASAGTNQVVVTVVGTNNAILFNDWLTFVLTPFSVTNGATITTNATIANVSLHGQKLSQPPPDVSGFLSGTATNFPVSTQNISFTIGLSYVPAENRLYAPVVTPTPNVTIRPSAPLPGKQLPFAFNVGFGVPYSLQASTNLTAWQTLFSAYGQSGINFYTNSTGTNPAQFFRLKL